MAMENKPFLVDLPIEHGDFLYIYSYVSLPEGKQNVGITYGLPSGNVLHNCRKWHSYSWIIY